MGFLLFCLFVGVVLLEEIERIPQDEWTRIGSRKILLLRRTRTRPAFMLALLVGMLFFAFELWLTLRGRSTFHPLQALGLFALLCGCYVYARVRKGPR